MKYWVVFSYVNADDQLRIETRVIVYDYHKKFDPVDYEITLEECAGDGESQFRVINWKEL